MASDQRTRRDEDLLEQWLASDAAHSREFNAHAAILNGIGDLADDDEARAILLGHDSDVERSRVLSRRQIIGAGLGTAAAVAAATFFPRTLTSDQVRNGDAPVESYSTRPGEQRQIKLTDGSMMMLNTESAVAVQYQMNERRVFLARGQAWFQVAKAPDRPFRVFIDGDEVRALGTAFDVRHYGGVVKVALEEGKVAIFRHMADEKGAPPLDASADVRPPAAILWPSQQAQLFPEQPPRILHVDLLQVKAWRYGQLILDATPLGEAVSDFNRYGGTQLSLADPQLAMLQISGIFHANRPEAFAEAVATSFPVSAQPVGQGHIVLRARSSSN